MPGANIRFTSHFDTLFTSSNKQGQFQFENVEADSFQLRVTYVGFKTFRKSYTTKGENIFKLPAITLKSDVKALAEIMVTARQPMVIKEDSVLYDADFYWVRSGSQAGDLVEQLPGISVDRDGNLTLFGEEIESIRVNGEEYFSGEISTALNNLPADIIEQVQVVDDYGERAKFTGVRMGASKKIINIDTNTDRGYTIRPHAALGSKERYLGDFSAHMMQGSREIAAFGSLYNTPSNPFRRPFGFGSSVRIVGGGPRGGSSGNRETEQYTAGAHYKNTFGEKTKINGNYRFSGNERTSSGRTEEQTLYEDFTNINNREYVNGSNESTHRLKYNVELQPDSVNKFFATPRLRISSTANNSETEYYVEQNNGTIPRVVEGSSTDQTEGVNTTVNIPFQYLRRFAKEGRSFKARVNTGFSNRNQEQQNRATNRVRSGGNTAEVTDTDQRIEQETNTFSANTNLSYTEPIGNKFITDIGYEFDYTNNINTQEVFDISGGDSPSAVDSLNTDFQKQSLRHQISASIQRRTDDYTLSIGLGLQQQSLNGQEKIKDIGVENSFLNILPHMQFRYTLSQGEYLRAMYNGGSSMPSFQQLQPVTDYSNPQYPVTGNPNLDAEYTHRFSLGYQKGFPRSGDYIAAGMSASQIKNKITPNIITEFEDDNTIIQETRYLNVDGARHALLRANVGKSIIGQELVLSTGGNVRYSNNLSFQNGQEAKGSSWGWAQNVRIAANIQNVIDASLAGIYNLNKTIATNSVRSNQQVKSFTVRITGENYFFENWTVGYRLSKRLYNSFEGSTNPTTLNLSIKHEFLKEDKASLSFRAVDILNQSDGISRTAYQNRITDRYTDNILARYFLLSFSLRLQEFK